MGDFNLSEEQTNASRQQFYDYINQLNYPRALENLSQLIQSGCEDAELIYKGARCSFELRNYQQALELIEKVLSLTPVHVDARILKGRIFLSLNYLGEALSVFDSTVAYCKPDEIQKSELRRILAFFFENNSSLLLNQYKNLFDFMSGKVSDAQSVTLTEVPLISASSLKIGFYMKWAKHSMISRGNVLGEELYVESICRVLKKLGFASQAELYAPNYLPKVKQDIMIYLSDTPIVPEWANKHVLYLQNGYEDSKKQLEKLYGFNYDAYIFISDELLKVHRGRSLKPGLFLPFGVDTSIFYPRRYDERLKCEVAYVGNDIKGKERTMKFLYPALDFDFALYGRWPLINQTEVWKNERYQLKFSQKCRGKIPSKYLPVLYSTASINLNCTIQDLIDWDTITLRCWEVLACRGFLISDGSVSSIKNLSDYIVFTDGGYDLHKKIEYYLAHPEERAAYAERGYEYVVEHETIEARMKELVDFLSAL